MATEQFFGPINYVVFTFEKELDLGTGLQALLDRVQDGTIEILDIELVARESSGAPTKLAFTDLKPSPSFELAVFDGVESGILDSDDLQLIAESLTPSQIALALVYEDRSLAAVAAAWSRVGGTELFSGGISMADLEEALEEGTLS